ncbi:Long-chain-fatty-acid--CoA ligase [Methylorubrum aminovorans]|uniref:Long-chain-fatty-acid--CoA ligase n=2 Tax=Methylorubrum aminovorans TaxID=269069 RepID=A0ABQ4UKZ9_9HYPH|nr:AMP-binding protein [Methylorubrum aminovorans]GJE68011.1 Long-chain-fatty-acid--CoA ligase [Methylorubrum aminovorans]
MTQAADWVSDGSAPDELLPWRRHFPDVADWDGPLEVMTLSELLAAGVARAGSRPLITFRNRTISFPEFAAQVDKLAAGLIALGLAPGSVLGLHLPNTPFHPLAFFAAARAGLTVMHLSGLDAPRELDHKLRVSGARVLVTTNLPGFLPAALRLLEAVAVDTILVGDDAEWGPSTVADPLMIPERAGLSPLTRLREGPLPTFWPQRSPDDVMLLQFTGGTTGLPKAAMLTHGNLTAAVSMHRLWRDYLSPGENLDAFEASMRTIGVLPLFHIYALTVVLLRAVRSGGEILLRQRFDPEEIIADIAVRRATVFAGVPTMWLALLNRPGIEAVDFSALRCCISGGAPLPFEVQARLGRLLGRELVIGWGMTETAPAGTLLPRTAARRPGVIGVPFPGVAMRVVSLDDSSRPVAPGETGELAIRGPNVFAGYLDQPEETQNAFRNGWFLTGDVGRMDEQGVFDLVDRRKNMLISGGFNVYPVVIEGAIYEHPDVAEVIVIGIPDPYLGQVPKAFVTLKPGVEAFSLEALQAFLAERIGRNEIPRALEFRETLPRSAAGKLLASVLVAEERAKRQAQSA